MLDSYGSRCLECRPSQLAFSFNGGKDSTAVLHLLLQGVREWKEANGEKWSPEDGLAGIHTFFFLGKDEFPEVQTFAEECDREHHLSMHTYTCAFKAGLQEMVEHRGIKAVFLGTRHGDPNCKDQVCKTVLFVIATCQTSTAASGVLSKCLLKQAMHTAH